MFLFMRQIIIALNDYYYLSFLYSIFDKELGGHDRQIQSTLDTVCTVSILFSIILYLHPTHINKQYVVRNKNVFIRNK